MKSLFDAIDRLLQLRSVGMIAPAMTPDGIDALNDVEEAYMRTRAQYEREKNRPWTDKEVKEHVEEALAVAKAIEGVSPTVFLSSERAKKVVRARHAFFYYLLCAAQLGVRGRTIQTLADAAGYDRLTVMHGAAKYAEYRKYDNPTNYSLKSKRAAAKRYQEKEKPNGNRKV